VSIKTELSSFDQALIRLAEVMNAAASYAHTAREQAAATEVPPVYDRSNKYQVVDDRTIRSTNTMLLNVASQLQRARQELLPPRADSNGRWSQGVLAFRDPPYLPSRPERCRLLHLLRSAEAKTTHSQNPTEEERAGRIKSSLLHAIEDTNVALRDNILKDSPDDKVQGHFAQLHERVTWLNEVLVDFWNKIS